MNTRIYNMENKLEKHFHLCVIKYKGFDNFLWSTNLWQGGHILAKIKFPVFSLSFPVLQKFSLCYFYAKTNT